MLESHVICQNTTCVFKYYTLALVTGIFIKFFYDWSLFCQKVQKYNPTVTNIAHFNVQHITICIDSFDVILKTAILGTTTSLNFNIVLLTLIKFWKFMAIGHFVREFLSVKEKKSTVTPWGFSNSHIRLQNELIVKYFWYNGIGWFERLTSRFESGTLPLLCNSLIA